MPEVIAGLAVPETAAAAEATELIRKTTSPLIYHHSRRIFFFGLIHAQRLGLEPDPELLYLSALFHDTGLFSGGVQRFELDSADTARSFLRERGFPEAAAETVWTAIALHTTPEIPARMGPEIAATFLGVLTDVIGFGHKDLEPSQVYGILDAHPRGDFKNGFLQAYVEGMRHRPETANGTVNADVLEHFVPGFRRTTTVERVLDSPWAS
ncbi:HD domain-containing protein [Paractinoplanes atraurantiacus]|uniref:HD domain-containing protein n=1 Tax=Paractinoplanes atraurantiacus TaxID=1036182 RepID=A0A285HFG4_9ACTN|nr:HD domain-containing protein [Actinoplanes atraurantiacus]SNY34418.1 HD domain-containing protein [Actinoplanes atraurantiacus]